MLIIGSIIASDPKLLPISPFMHHSYYLGEENLQMFLHYLTSLYSLQHASPILEALPNPMQEAYNT